MDVFDRFVKAGGVCLICDDFNVVILPSESFVKFYLWDDRRTDMILCDMSGPFRLVRKVLDVRDDEVDELLREVKVRSSLKMGSIEYSLCCALRVLV